MFGLSLCLLLLATCAGATVSKMGASHSDAAPLPKCAIPRTTENIAIDGDLAEDAWAATPVIDQFSFPWWTQGAKDRTEARLLWDDDNLYIIYQCVDPYLDSEVKAHDGPVYNEDAVEIFATPNAADVSTYYGYEMNINGTLLDYIAFGGGEEWTPNIQFTWQSEGVKIATTYDGTLNDHSDTDRGWILEIAIPHDNFRHLGGQIPPVDGDTWRASLSRTAGYKGQFGLWSDTGAPTAAFHHAAYFGIFTFSKAVVGR